MTRAETLLWRYLKAGHLDGLSFRRQVPMKAYIADFVCHSGRLVIEVDGESHDFQSRQQGDLRRDEWFESQGYAVLRFTNDQVVTNLSGVVEMIRQAASARLPLLPPSLSLPHKGGGNTQATHPQTLIRQTPLHGPPGQGGTEPAEVQRNEQGGVLGEAPT